VVSGGSLLPGFRDNGPASRDRRLMADEQWDSEPPLQRLLFSRRLIYVLVSLAVVLGGGLLTWWLTSGQYTTVPSVHGWTASLASSELKNLHLQAKDGPGRHSDLPRGKVISTSPKAGSRIKTGGTVTLTLSLGPVMIPVPSVTGEQLAQAQEALRHAGLTPGTATQETSTSIPAGVVISTSPQAGTEWPKNKPVGITVSAGLPLPDFRGEQVSQAQGTAQAGGYSINPVVVPNSNQPANTILRQSPKPGTPITSGEVVTVYVSKGPPSANVPDVTGMTAQQAIQVLKAAGFNVQINKQGPGNRVLGYGPNGTQPKGTVITINVGFSFF
jgi:serine/threonine-protein kinase